MNVINRSNLRMLGSLMFVLALVGLLLAGCRPAPPPEIKVRVKNVVTRCDGTFEAKVDVSQNNTGETQDISIVLADLDDIKPGAAADPPKLRLADGDTEPVSVTGTLKNSCLNGSLNFKATGATVIVTGADLIKVKPVPVKGTAPNKATPNSNGVFTYDVIFECCPGVAKEVHQIDLSGDNVTDLKADPSTVNCPKVGAQKVSVSGKLIILEQEGEVSCLATGPAPAGGTCTLITKVKAARPAGE